MRVNVRKREVHTSYELTQNPSGAREYLMTAAYAS